MKHTQFLRQRWRGISATFSQGLLNNLWQRLTKQGVQATTLWIVDHAVRIITGAPIQRTSQITTQLHVGGQYRRRGWPILTSRGITAVVNMRLEFDDNHAGIAPKHYLYLPTVDDEAPTLEQLHTGVTYITDQLNRGGSVYVHCGSGVGRAATMAAAYLISTGLRPDQAWARIRETRPFIRPTAVQVAQIERFVACEEKRVKNNPHLPA